MAITDTEVSIFTSKILEGKIGKLALAKDTFTCGAFMKNVMEDSSYIGEEKSTKEVMVSVKKGMTSEEVLIYWIDKIKELGVQAEYFGLEKEKYNILYTVPKTNSPVTRLLYFTILRYGWAKPYVSLVKVLMDKENSDKKIKEEIKKEGYWTVFSKYHISLSKRNDYSSTFGLSNSCTTKIVQNDSFIKMFDPKNTLLSFDSINNRYSKVKDKNTSKYNSDDYKVPTWR